MSLSWRSGAGYSAIRAARDAFLASEIRRITDEEGAVEIDGFPGYFVTPRGDTYATSGRRLTRLRPGRKASGYRFVGLTSGAGERKYEMVHRLVAKAFIANPLDLPAVNHRDLNKSNNCTTNLEWVTHSENSRHAIESGVVVVGQGSRLLTPDAIAEVKAARGTYREIGLRFGCSAQTVCNIKRGHSAQPRLTLIDAGQLILKGASK